MLSKDGLMCLMNVIRKKGTCKTEFSIKSRL